MYTHVSWNTGSSLVPQREMTENIIKVKPPVNVEDISSTFEVEYEEEQIVIDAFHHWDVGPDVSVWSGLTYDEISDNLETTDWKIEIHREYKYRPRDSDVEHITCYVSKFCDVPDVHGFNDNSKYSHDFPDPWLFTPDNEGDIREELRVKDNSIVQRELQSFHDHNDELQMKEWYEPKWDDPLTQSGVLTFAHAHHFGIADPFPGVEEQVNDVLTWLHPDAITLEEYKELHVDDAVTAVAD